MKAIGIVGFKDSGKTTLTGLLADALEKVGHTVAIAKFAHHKLDKSDRDTERLMKPGRIVVGLGNDEAAIFWSRKRHLPDLLPLLAADVLLVEGGKQLGWLPRVVCLRNAQDEQELGAGLAVAAWNYRDSTSPTAGGLPVFDQNSIAGLAFLAVERGFTLPALDCGECGEEDCAGLAQRIVAGSATPADCKSLGDDFTVTVGGAPIGMNPFVARIVSGAIKGMLSELKGYSPGPVEIHIK
ncbi:molybdopterin-guanine dinucleotide biosynthesis protein MobB [Oleidesulfovibrio sp.]|uniref:molybdopterin-guanine dinucleotide biosynthesis protein MobB n=1 Tax=Oleidesulfovibrio sp. TaxID=2909707 RepID=UPI003A84C3F5